MRAALEESRALLYQRLELNVGNVGEGKGEDGPGLGCYEREVAVEEDGVKDPYGLVSLGSFVRDPLLVSPGPGSQGGEQGAARPGWILTGTHP